MAEKDLEGLPTLGKAKAVAEVINDTNNPVILLDEKGATLPGAKSVAERDVEGAVPKMKSNDINNPVALPDGKDEKPSGTKRDFSGVASVAEQRTPITKKAKAVAEDVKDTKRTEGLVALLDEKVKYSGFRPVSVMKEELIKKFGELDLTEDGDGDDDDDDDEGPTSSGWSY